MEDVLTQTKFDILRTRLTQTVLPLTERLKKKLKRYLNTQTFQQEEMKLGNIPM